ncbi:MAG: PKD domain-containing protein [Rhodoferax sp.]
MSNQNTVPIANAGNAQSVVAGTTVTLNASGSSDADGNALTYVWTLSSKPSSSAATLTGNTSSNPTFVADVAGIYVAALIVNDGKLDTRPSRWPLRQQQSWDLIRLRRFHPTCRVSAFRPATTRRPSSAWAIPSP